MTQPHSTLRPSTTKLLTNKQRIILTHLFTYRFLTIKHLQTFLHYKDKRYIQTLLNDLLKKGYLHQIYDSSSFKATGTPAIYYLAVNGVRFIRTLERYTEPELRKRYADTSRSTSYLDHCLLMATCGAALQTSSNETTTYRWITQTDYARTAPSARAEFLQEQQPHLYYRRERGNETARYVLEHFHDRLPNTRIRRRIRALITHDLYQYEDEAEWPVLLLVCDTLMSLIYVKRYTRSLIRDDDLEHPTVRVTTAEQVRTEGVTGAIWEEVA